MYISIYMDLNIWSYFRFLLHRPTFTYYMQENEGFLHIKCIYRLNNSTIRKCFKVGFFWHWFSNLLDESVDFKKYEWIWSAVVIHVTSQIGQQFGQSGSNSPLILPFTFISKKLYFPYILGNYRANRRVHQIILMICSRNWVYFFFFFNSCTYWNANQDNIVQKTKAVFSNCGKNWVPMIIFWNSHLGISRSLSSKDVRDWNLRFWPQTFLFNSEKIKKTSKL